MRKGRACQKCAGRYGGCSYCREMHSEQEAAEDRKPRRKLNSFERFLVRATLSDSEPFF